MGTIYLIMSAAVSWAIFRIIAGRATLSTAQFACVFAFGAVASTILAIGVEGLIGLEVEQEQLIKLYAGPVDEIAKALPLLIVIACFAARRALTISDYVLIGLAGGLGYTFVHWNLAELAGITPFIWSRYLLGSLHVEAGSDHSHSFFVGAVTTAFVGLVAGVGVRLARRRSIMAAVTLAGLLMVIFENCTYRWQVGSLSAGWPMHYGATPPSGFGETSSWIVAMHGALFNGRIELWLLVGGLLVATWLEGRWTTLAAVAGREQLLLDEDARVPLVLVEWIVAIQRLPIGRAAFELVNRYFRDRRAYALVRAESLRIPPERQLAAKADEIEQRIMATRSKVALQTSSDVMSQGAVGRSPSQRMATLCLYFLVVVLVIVFFMVPPNDWQTLKSTLFSDGLAFTMVTGAIVIAVWGALIMWSSRRSVEFAAMPSEQFERHLDTLLMSGAIIAIAIAIIASFLPFAALVPDYSSYSGAILTSQLEPFELWSSYGGYQAGYGGNPHTFFAAAALILACIAAVRMQRR